MKKKVKKKIAKKRVTVTAPQAQAIRALAEQLGKLIALSGFRSSFSLTTIAKERGLSKYLPAKAANKKEAFYEFLRNLYCQKPRTIRHPRTECGVLTSRERQPKRCRVFRSTKLDAQTARPSPCRAGGFNTA